MRGHRASRSHSRCTEPAADPAGNVAPRHRRPRSRRAVGRARRGESPHREVQLLRGVPLLHRDDPGVSQAEAPRTPRRLGHDLVRHQRLEHAAGRRWAGSGTRCRGRCSALPRRGTPCRTRVPDRRPVATAGHWPCNEKSGSVSQRFGGSVRHVRHHTSPGIWCRPMPMYIAMRGIAVDGAVVVAPPARRPRSSRRTSARSVGCRAAGVDVAPALRPVVVEDREVHRRRAATRPAASLRAAPAARRSDPQA